MSPEKQRIAIAEQLPKLFVICKPIASPFCYYRKGACGYTSITEAWKVTEEVARRYIHGKPDEPDRVIMFPAPIPDYLHDLNAMAEAEATLDGAAEAMDYADNLEWVIDRQNSPCVGRYRLATATATQRAEAFLRTIGKWEDS